MLLSTMVSLRSAPPVAVISLLSDDATEFINLRIVGYPDEVKHAWLRFSASLPMAIPDAVRLGLPVILETWEERVERYPDFHHIRLPGSDGALVAIPMLVQARAIGAIGLSFAAERQISAADRDFMLAIAGQCAQALERARLYDSERAAREQAECEARQHREARAVIAEKEAQFRLLFANHPHPMWVYDLDTFAFLFVNEAAVAAYGYTHEQFGQMRITDIRPQEEVPAQLTAPGSARLDLRKSGIWRHQTSHRKRSLR